MTSIITIITVIVFSSMFIAMLIAQGRHRTKLARQAKLAQLSEQIKRLQNTLSTLPPKYWTQELRDFIFQSLITAYKQSIEINPKQKEYLQSDLQLVINQRQQTKNNNQTDTTVEHEKVNLYRNALRTIHSYIQDSYSVKRITSSLATHLIEQTEIKMLEATCDFYINAAKHNLDKEKYKEAHSHSQKAIDAISKSQHKEKFSQQNIELINFIKEIQTKWREFNAENNKSATSNSLSENIEAMNDGEQWQKKQDYD
ncbi:MAG: hypothetical protein HRU38_06080 [Saccharospirillaceae bacterium]|nr:hypothetical protein [Pseudomonadales bacterium]NRB78226.1 hypothetical protein [Saccharospirillaceae bacterium]